MSKKIFMMSFVALFMVLGMSQDVMANGGMVQCKMDEVCIMNDTIKSDVSYKVSDKKVIFPQGFYLDGDECWRIMFPDGIGISDYSMTCSTKVTELVGLKKLGAPKDICNMYCPKSAGVSNLSDDEVTKLIKEKLSIAWPDYDFNTNDYLKEESFNLSYYGLNKPRHISVLEVSETGHPEIGWFFDGHYYSKNTLVKKKEAKEAAAEKNFKAEIAKFKRKYGFDPSVNDVKYIVKVGRNLLGILDARNEWVDEYADNRNNKVTVKLEIDRGASKCYKFYWFNTAYFCGYFWVKNNVITSIHWER